MALISCISCGAKISDKAIACPKCGWTNQSEPPLANTEDLRTEEERKGAEELKARKNPQGIDSQGNYDPGLARSRNKQKDDSISIKNPQGINSEGNYDPGLARSRDQKKEDSISIDNPSLPAILFGFILFTVSIFAIKYQNNLDQYGNTPCYESCSWECIKYVRELIGGKRKSNKVENWAANNLPNIYDQSYDACFVSRNEAGDGITYLRLMLKMNQKYLNEKQ